MRRGGLSSTSNGGSDSRAFSTAQPGRDGVGQEAGEARAKLVYISIYIYIYIYIYICMNVCVGFEKMCIELEPIRNN